MEALGDAVSRHVSPPEFDALFDKLAAAYAACVEPERERIRAAVRISRWATAGFWGRECTSFFQRFCDTRQPADMKRALILISIRNGGDDPRDAIAAVDDIVYWAKASSLDAVSILRDVAMMSSSEPMLGMGSMRELLEGRAAEKL